MPVNQEQIRELPTQDLALAFLQMFASEMDPENFNIHSLFREADQVWFRNQDKALLTGRMSDAWAWLIAHGLLGPSTFQEGWFRLTASGYEVAADRAALSSVWASERLSGQLEPELEAKVRPIFNSGDYATACFVAMREVEIIVRKAAALEAKWVGTDLMRKAFRPDDGALADQESLPAERQAVADLFAGAIGAFKNPSSHRVVEFEDPVEAAEIVQLADLLLRLVARAAERNV